MASSYHNSQTRTDFTKTEDGFLAQYLAKYNPQPKGRSGNSIYRKLVDNEEQRWPWSRTHSWQSWRQRYVDKQSDFNRRIDKIQVGKKAVSGRDTPLTPPSLAPKREPTATPSRSQRVPFTDEDDRHLISFLAVEHPNPKNRLGNVIYNKLMSNEGGKWPWSVRHPTSSWQGHYKKKQDWFDECIEEYRKYHMSNAEGPSEREHGVGKRRAQREVEEQPAEFTQQHDRSLAKFLAFENPDGKDRLSSALWKRFVDDKVERPWAAKYPWNVWRDRYKENRQMYDDAIAKYIVKYKLDAEDSRHEGEGKSEAQTARDEEKNNSRLEDRKNRGIQGAKRRRVSEHDGEDRRVDKRRRIGEHQDGDEAQFGDYGVHLPEEEEEGTQEAAGTISEEEDEAEVDEHVIVPETEEAEEDEGQVTSASDNYRGDAFARKKGSSPEEVAALPSGEEGPNEDMHQSEEEDEPPTISRPQSPSPELEYVDYIKTEQPLQPPLYPDPNSLPSPRLSSAAPEPFPIDSTPNNTSQNRQALPSQVIPSPETLAKLGALPESQALKKVSQEPTPPTSNAPNTPSSSQEPTHRKSGPYQLIPSNNAAEAGPSHNRATPSQPPPRKHKRKINDDMDFFASSPPVPESEDSPIVQRVHRQPRALVEGAFNSAFTDAQGRQAFKKGARRVSGVDDERESSPEVPEPWPPRRKGKEREITRPIPARTAETSQAKNATPAAPTVNQPGQAEAFPSRSSSASPPNRQHVDLRENGDESSQEEAEVANHLRISPENMARLDAALEKLKHACQSKQKATMRVGEPEPEPEPDVSANAGPLSRKEESGPVGDIESGRSSHEEPSRARPVEESSEKPEPSTFTVTDGFRRLIPHNAEERALPSDKGKGKERALPHPFDHRRNTFSVGTSGRTHSISSHQPRDILRSRLSTTDHWRRPSIVHSRSASSASHISLPMFEGKALRASDRELAVQAGMEQCILKIAQNHGFLYEVAHNAWVETGSLEATDQMLGEMRKKAQEAGEQFVDLYREESRRMLEILAYTPEHPEVASILNHAPMDVDEDRASPEYNPPADSRAGLIARLRKKGRMDEALLRSSRRASGFISPRKVSSNLSDDEARVEDDVYGDVFE